MAITDPIVLAPGTVLTPVSELPERVRRRLPAEPGAFALTLPRVRTPSRLLDASAAALVEEFRAPSTVVEAVVRHSRGRHADPEATLEEAYPLLRALLEAGFLVAQDAEGAPGSGAVHAPGEEVGGFTILECIQSAEDTELYQARRGEEVAALKIARPGAVRLHRRIAREAAVLAHLGGEPAPRLLAAGEHAGRAFTAATWCRGIDAAAAAAELRRRGDTDRPALLGLCQRIAGAYARLHERGVVHGDVHPGNVLVGPEGDVRLIDFGLAVWLGAPRGLGRAGRGAAGFYLEPEAALAELAGRRLPAASAAGEQHVLASLLYLLLTGAHWRDFSLVREEALREIATAPLLSLAERGVTPWPEVEEILARALAKAPEERFASIAELARALAAVPVPAAASRLVSTRAGRASGRALAAVLARVLERVGMDGPLVATGLPEAPRASLNFGAAGIAYALYRMAVVREDAPLLALADLWSLRAERSLSEDGEEAFANPGIGVPADGAGPASPYHQAPGLYAVSGLLAHARCDPAAGRRAIDAFLGTAAQPCPEADLTLGRAGALLAASLLLEADAATRAVRGRLLAFGTECMAGLWAEIDALPPLAGDAGRLDQWPGMRRNLGIAHGWAGLLYASLRWCRAAGIALPESLPACLAELAGRAQPWGRGLRWRWVREGDGTFSMAGWCNGSAGFVHLWTLAHQTLGEPSYLDLAEGAAWNAWEAPGRRGDLCCGLAGRAYALLNLDRHLRRVEAGDASVWLDRARALAERAAEGIARTETPNSLYRGEIGVALLAVDIQRPDGAAMPFFEEEGWVEDEDPLPVPPSR